MTYLVSIFIDDASDDVHFRFVKGGDDIVGVGGEVDQVFLGKDLLVRLFMKSDALPVHRLLGFRVEPLFGFSGVAGDMHPYRVLRPLVVRIAALDLPRD